MPYDWRDFVAQNVKTVATPSEPKKRYGGHGAVVTGGKKDPVMGFLHGATDFVKGLADDVSKHQHIDMAYKPAIKVGKAYVAQKKRDLLPQRGKTVNLATAHTNELALSPGRIGDILMAGKFFFKPGEDFTLEKALQGVSKNYSKKDPFTRLPNVAKHLPEKAPEGYPRGVGGRVPFLVHQRTGRVAVGNFGESHGEIGAKLMDRGVHVQRRALGGRPHPEDWLEGWVHPVHRPGQPPQYAMHLSTRGLDGYVPPDALNGLKNLVQSITRDLKDAHVTVKTKAGEIDDTRSVMAARQGEHRMSALESKLPQMSEKDFMKFLDEELKRRKR